MQGEQATPHGHTPSTVVSHRPPTRAEAAYIERQAQKLRRKHSFESRALYVLAPSIAVAGVFLWSTSSTLFGMALFAIALPSWLMGISASKKVLSKPANQVTCGRFLCHSEEVQVDRRGNSYTIYRVGDVQVYPWLPFWPEGEVAFVEFCPLVRNGGYEEAVLVSLPGIDVQALDFVGPPPRRYRGFLSWQP